ncbi:hypothetical protein FHR81_004276 [Actinoalloteichus hoggarensis]|uniref:Uncharacterized protein n=1 Tax=Actinoalloteichus hoggarensis TaxID=1470176 RepID=A0A221W8W4_9PSEU|nr:hypothetical protein AHOG_23810 [Actinoalloteichus hoggarensis]MBB5923209.1 hypothetical protein [Actinoalloteichus hoggarensis]
MAVVPPRRPSRQDTRPVESRDSARSQLTKIGGVLPVGTTCTRSPR